MKGYQAMTVKNDAATAVSLFQRAVSLDPNFAMAYARLGTSYGNLGQTARAAENTRKAYDLRDKVSERERFRISANYYLLVTGELEKAIQANQRIRRMFNQTTARKHLDTATRHLRYHPALGYL